MRLARENHNVEPTAKSQWKGHDGDVSWPIELFFTSFCLLLYNNRSIDLLCYYCLLVVDFSAFWLLRPNHWRHNDDKPLKSKRNETHSSCLVFKIFHPLTPLGGPPSKRINLFCRISPIEGISWGKFPIGISCNFSIFIARNMRSATLCQFSLQKLWK